MCVCEEEPANVAVGFSLYADRMGVRSLAVATRCTVCGRMGCVAEWMLRAGGLEPLGTA